MEAVAEQIATPTAAPAVGKRKLWFSLALFSILWLDLCHQLSYMWSTNEQYAYGWFVPILALGLFLKKWPTRPAVSSQSSIVGGFAVSSPVVRGLVGLAVSSPVVRGLVVLLAVLLLPLRVIHEINQDWSFCSYLLTVCVVGLSLYAVFLLGGWPWVKYFAFPICFILVAVNWPYRIENSLKHRMMNAVAALTVEIAGWLNIPALRHGNVIELATGSVGVEDACSGIRSLQSTIMAGFFLGELYLLTLPRRFLLVAIGVPLAFAFNIARTLFLTWQASASGSAGVTKWHDSAGMTISLVCFACLWLIALWLRRSTTPETPVLRRFSEGGSTLNSQPVTTLNSQLSTLDPSTLNPQLSTSAKWSVVSGQWSVVSKYLVACGLWSLISIITTEVWYRSHETDPAQTVRWTAQFPTNAAAARPIYIDKEVRQVLRCDQGEALSWQEQDGGKWSAYFFRWRSGEATSRMAARDHRPEICLPSRGYKVKTDLGLLFVLAQGLQLPFRGYVFDDGGHVLYVFFCLWEDGADKQTGLGKSKYLDRLDSVLGGKRRLGQQTLELVLSGYGTMEEAEQALRQRLPSLVQLGLH